MTEAKRVDVRITHAYGASPERVFDAWLDPSKATKFLFATDKGQIVRCDIDARVGGTFTIVDRRDVGDVEHVGTYAEIDRPRRLVFDYTVPKYSAESTRITIDIVPRGGGCELSLTQVGALEEFIQRTQHGWTTILAGLDKELLMLDAR